MAFAPKRVLVVGLGTMGKSHASAYARIPGFEIAGGNLGIVTSDLTKVEEPVHIKVRGSAPSFARREGKQLSMAVTESFRLTPNYASLSQRRHETRRRLDQHLA